MRGHISARTLTDGRKVWDLVVDLPRHPDGHRNQKWFRGLRTRRNAQQKLTEVLRSLDQGSYVEPTKQTVAEYLAEWLAAIKATVRPTTWNSYSRIIEQHILPSLGRFVCRTYLPRP